MGSRGIKKQVFSILTENELSDVLIKLSVLPAKDIINPLFSAICHSDELLRWYGISSMGVTVARIAERELENARIIMRRILWSLNDESGGIGWGAPEAFAEILVHHAGLTDEYVHMLISYMRGDGPEPLQQGNFLEYELLQRGLIWGIGRLAAFRSDLLREKNVINDIIPYLISSDIHVRGLAARALGFLHAEKTIGDLENLKSDNGNVRLYENGRFINFTVSEISSLSIEQIRNSEHLKAIK